MQDTGSWDAPLGQLVLYPARCRGTVCGKPGAPSESAHFSQTHRIYGCRRRIRLRVGSTTKIITALVMVPPSAMVVEFGFSMPWTPKLIASVASRVTTLWPLIQARIFSLLTQRPKPTILATLSILYTADHITPHRPMPAKKLDDAVGVKMDMVKPPAN